MHKFLFVSFLWFFSNGVFANPIEGKWYSFDDKTGSPVSEITVTLVGEELQGFITKLMTEGADQKAVCLKCEGKRKGLPILNLQIMSGYVCDVKGCQGGKLLDPRTGKVYDSNVKLKDDNTLIVRGYVGSPMFGKSKIWKRNY